MAYSTGNKGIFITRRGFPEEGGSIEMIFEADAIKHMYLMEGRLDISAWERDAARGYLYLEDDGTIGNGYGGTMIVTNLITGLDTDGTYTANVPHKIVITNVTVDKYINLIGVRYSKHFHFEGKLHAIKTTGAKCGWVDKEELYSDLHFQFQHINNQTPPSSNLSGLNKHPVKGLNLVPPNSNYSAWNNNPALKTWTRRGVGWGALFLYGKEVGSHQQKNYERLVRIQFDLQLNGKELYLYYILPGGSSVTLPLEEGKNDHLVWISKNSAHEPHYRCKVDAMDADGVVLTNIDITESHDALIQGGVSWTNE